MKFFDRGEKKRKEGIRRRLPTKQEKNKPKEKSDKKQRKRPKRRQKEMFRNEFPIDRPKEEKNATKFKRTSKITPKIDQHERNTNQNLKNCTKKQLGNSLDHSETFEKQKQEPWSEKKNVHFDGNCCTIYNASPIPFLVQNHYYCSVEKQHCYAIVEKSQNED